MRHHITTAFAVAGLIWACSSGSGSASGTGSPVASGSVTGGTAEPGTLAVAWIVTSGSPDYEYWFGKGSFDGTKFVVSVSGDPPAEAINSYGIGVGLVVLLVPNASAPATGKTAIPDSQIAGLSADYAIIWKDPAKPGLDWSGDFPAGYACGKCVPASTTSFDSFAVVDCNTLEITVGASKMCNWT